MGADPHISSRDVEQCVTPFNGKQYLLPIFYSFTPACSRLLCLDVNLLSIADAFGFEVYLALLMSALQCRFVLICKDYLSSVSLDLCKIFSSSHFSLCLGGQGLTL